MNFNNLPNSINQSTANKIAEVISVFENAHKNGNYDSITIYRDFKYNKEYYRQITYGRFQTTEFGNLKKLIQMYIADDGNLTVALMPYVNDIGKIKNNNPSSLYQDDNFVNALKTAGTSDPIMQRVQEDFFEKIYFQPALAWFSAHQFTLPLSLLVIFDSYIHSGGIRDLLRKRFPEYPPSLRGNEKTWITQYVAARHAWLSNYETPEVRASKYRTQLFKNLIVQDNWNLVQPFTTQGVQF